MSFESLGLKIEFVRALHDKDYQALTPIQQQAITAILTGNDLKGNAHKKRPVDKDLHTQSLKKLCPGIYGTSP
jgi:hypothetical protein